MTDRYSIRPAEDVDHADGRTPYRVVDRLSGSYSREGGDRYVAQCPDPEMAQRIADLLNAEPMIDELGRQADAYMTMVHGV